MTTIVVSNTLEVVYPWAFNKLAACSESKKLEEQEKTDEDDVMVRTHNLFRTHVTEAHGGLDQPLLPLNPVSLSMHYVN